MGEYGWWGNRGIFGGWGSWVKYGGKMEGVGKCVGVWGEVREDVLGVREVCWGVGKYGEVWGMGSRCVEMCLGCGKRCGKGIGVRAT